MNCLDFRRRLLTDPLGSDAELASHEAECPGCATFARDARADEIRLRGLLRSPEPSPGLAERVQLAARFERRAERRRRGWYGIAASVLMAVTASMVSLVYTSVERGNEALAQAVLHHIEDEAHHLREARPVSASRVKWVFARFGAELTGDLGPVNFAAECLMRKRNGVHLVMQGEAGPITVFFMPGEMTDGPLPVNSERFAGRILPTAWGSIAIVGERGEKLDGLGERLAATVRWRTDATAGSIAVDDGLAVVVRGNQQQDG